MIQLDIKSKLLFVFLCLSLCLSVALSYYRFFVQHDYYVVLDEDLGGIEE